MPPGWGTIKQWTIQDARTAQTVEIFKILDGAWQDWSNGIEWHHSPTYKWQARPQWYSKYHRDKMISFLDNEFTRELATHKAYWDGRGHDTHPMFFNMSDEHVHAMCQRLDELIAHPVDGIPLAQEVRNTLDAVRAEEARVAQEQRRQEEGWFDDYDG